MQNDSFHSFLLGLCKVTRRSALIRERDEGLAMKLQQLEHTVRSPTTPSVAAEPAQSPVTSSPMKAAAIPHEISTMTLNEQELSNTYAKLMRRAARRESARSKQDQMESKKAQNQKQLNITHPSAILC